MTSTTTEDTADETDNSVDELLNNRAIAESETSLYLSHREADEMQSTQKEVIITKPKFKATIRENDSFSVHKTKSPIVSGAFEDDDDQREFQLQLANECVDNGMLHWGEAEYPPALSLFKRSLEIREEVLGKLYDDTAKSYLWVGSIHWHMAHHELAMDNFARCFRIKFHLYESKNKCGSVCTWIDTVLDAVGDDKLSFWKKLMSSIEHERKGDDLVEVMGFENAIKEYQTALRFEFYRLRLEASTPNRPLVDVADLHSKIAFAMMALGNTERAMMEYRQALHIYLDKFGLHHGCTIKTLQGITASGEMLGFRKEVVESYMDDLYDTIYLEKSADLDVEREYYAVAIQKYQRVLQREHQGLGHLQGYYGVICSKLVMSHRCMGHNDEAMRCACTALGIFNRILGSRHHETSGAMRTIEELVAKTKAIRLNQTFEV